MTHSCQPCIEKRISWKTDPDSLLKDLNKGLTEGRIPAAIFGNEALHDRELEKIFARCWVFMAHESEIGANGDYVLRKIGEDDFIVIRDEDGQINVLLDACRHRGVQLCRADAGNTTHFKCPYHGWTYDSKGQFVGAPLFKQALHGMDKSANGLARASKVESFHGFIFATLDENAPSLREYLGGMAWYLDLVFGLNGHGVEVLCAPQRFVFEADWKTGSENFSGDDYHLGTLHRSVWEIDAFPLSFAENMKGYHIQAAPGHSLSFSMANEGDDSGPNYFGYPSEFSDTFDASHISAEQLEIARRSRVFIGNVFPNFAVLALPMTEDGSKHAPTGIITVRTWQPKGAGKVEVWNWFIGYKNMTPEQKERVYKAGLGTFSMGGSFEMDDTEPMMSIVRNGRSVAVDRLGFKLNYQMGMNGVGIAEQVPQGEWPGPGVVYKSRFEEGVMRNMYRYYTALMHDNGTGAWPIVKLGDDEGAA